MSVSSPAKAKDPDLIYLFWIPAYAGMTKDWIPAYAGMTKDWIPAYAGMTKDWIPAYAGMTGATYNPVVAQIIFVRSAF